jgi:hypothetical protein
MLKQTSDLCPGLDIRFPGPYTSLTGLSVLPCRPGQLHALSAQSRSKFPLFSFHDPNHCATAPAFYYQIGIPAFSRGNQLYFGIRWCIYHSMAADWASDMAHLSLYLIGVTFLSRHFAYAPSCFRHCPA